VSRDHNSADIWSESAARTGFDSVSELLVDGGDARISLTNGVNQYGRSAFPRAEVAEFGSATASTISEGAYAACQALYGRLKDDLANRPDETVYRDELERIRSRLRAYFHIEAMDAGIVIGASGTDIHLVAAVVLRTICARPLTVLGVARQETGSGIPDALAARRFALAQAVDRNRATVAFDDVLYEAFSARAPDGAPIGEDIIERGLEAAIVQARSQGRAILLVVTDVSKTGLIAPSLETVWRLRRRWGSWLHILVDACQARISAKTLQAYIRNGCWVAVTGSKFLTGPAFCGALFLPSSVAGAAASIRLPRPLGLHVSRAEWPQTWRNGSQLPLRANLGLLMRWEAALYEADAFSPLDLAGDDSSIRRFATAILQRLQADPLLEPVPVTPLARPGLSHQNSWDTVQTIFPFWMRRKGGDQLLSFPEVERIYRQITAIRGSLPSIEIGQPVACGVARGAPLGALRLCFSARLAARAAGSGRRDENTARGLAVLDRVGQIVEAGTV